MSIGLAIEPQVLLDESDASVLRPRGANPGRRLIQPAYYVDNSAADEITYVLSVGAIGNGPSAFRLKPRLMFAVDHTVWGQFTAPRWFYVDESPGLLERVVVGGAAGWLPTITEASGPAGNGLGTWQATIRHFPRHVRIDFGESGPDAFTMTGDASPYLRVSCVQHSKITRGE